MGSESEKNRCTDDVPGNMSGGLFHEFGIGSSAADKMRDLAGTREAKKEEPAIAEHMVYGDDFHMSYNTEDSVGTTDDDIFCDYSKLMYCPVNVQFKRN